MSFTAENLASILQSLAVPTVSHIVPGSVSLTDGAVHFEVRELSHFHVTAAVATDGCGIVESVENGGPAPQVYEYPTLGAWLRFLVDGDE